MSEATSPVLDETLARAVQRGDQEAFNELMRRYETKLRRYGQRFLARVEDVEDAVQEVFLKAYENMQSYDPSYRFSPWIYRIAHNTYVNMLRKQSHRSFGFFDFDTLVSPLTFSQTNVDRDHANSRLRQELDSGLSKIDGKYREVLVLYYFEELSYDEIADILRIPVGTVGVRLRRGREALRRACEGIDFEDLETP